MLLYIQKEISLSLKCTYVPYKSKCFFLIKRAGIVFVYFVLGMEGKKMDCYMHFLGKLKGRGGPISLTFNTY